MQATARVPLGDSGLQVSRLGFGSFKIGRNQEIKYPAGYELPDEAETGRLLNGVLDLGINLIDTAPAYGLAEERIGRAISHRRDEFVLSTKVGETFADGRSVYDFSEPAVRLSLERSLKRLQTDVLDAAFIHSNGDDERILRHTPVVDVLLEFRERGIVRAIGLSGKTLRGAELSLEWADLLMVEYNLDDRSHERILATAAARGLGVLVKKGLGSGHLPAADSIRFVLCNPAVSSLIVGGLNIDHIASNLHAVDGKAA